MKKQLLLFIMMLLPMIASADESGTCGVNITWKYVESTHTLTLTGTGDLYVGIYPEQVPWYSLRNDINTVILEFGITSIGGYSFNNYTNLTSLIIPNSVTHIWDAFSGCISLESLNIPNSVTYIGSSAFSGCISLKSLFIPSSVTKIENTAFYGCSGLTSIIVDRENTKYDSRDDCNAIIQSANNTLIMGSCSTIIPQSVTSIGEGAFHNCDNLTTITIPENVTSISKGVFSGCGNLSSIIVDSKNNKYDSRDNCNAIIETSTNTIIEGCNNSFIPTSVNSIGESAFAGRKRLSSIEIPNSVTTIGFLAFSGCTTLNNISFPSSLETIGAFSFKGCSGLTSITINGVASYDSDVFSGCINLNSVYTSDIASWCQINFSSAESNPLYYAQHFYVNNEEIKENLVIPSSVSHILRDCFINRAMLKTITLEGESVNSIGYEAFRGCSQCTDFYCYSKIVPIVDQSTFSGTNIEYATLHVPAVFIEEYRKSNVWQKFKYIVAIEGTHGEKCAKPNIYYRNGKLSFTSETEGAEFVSTISNSDMGSYDKDEILLNVTYEIQVFAKAFGYYDSELVTASLCWIDVEPRTEGVSNSVAQVPAKAVLIKNDSGVLTVEGAEDGTQVRVYGVNGVEVGSGISRNGLATVSTNLKPGSVAIIKIGNRSVKVVVR